jgi:hypothetical protein
MKFTEVQLVEKGIENVGQGSERPNINVKGILVPFLNPIELFNSLLEECFERKNTLRKENYKITKLYDMLFPELILDQLQFSDVKPAYLRTV